MVCVLAFELHQTPEVLIESPWLDRLIEMSPGCHKALKARRPMYDLPPALRDKQKG